MRLYDFVVVASQLLRRGATFGALQAFQPCVGELEDQKARPSDDHVLLRPLDSTAKGPLPEEDASIERQVNRLHKSRPSDLSYMKGWHHLKWHRIRKDGSFDWRGRRDRFHSLELVVRVDPTSTTLIDLLNGRLMGNPSLVEMTDRSSIPTEVFVILSTNSCHRLLETGQFILKIFDGVVQDV